MKNLRKKDEKNHQPNNSATNILKPSPSGCHQHHCHHCASLASSRFWNHMTLFFIFSYKLSQPQTSFLQTSCNRLHEPWYSKTIVNGVSGRFMTVDTCIEYQVYINRFVFESNVTVSILTMAKIDSEYQISFITKAKY